MCIFKLRAAWHSPQMVNLPKSACAFLQLIILWQNLVQNSTHHHLNLLIKSMKIKKYNKIIKHSNSHYLKKKKSNFSTHFVPYTLKFFFRLLMLVSNVCTMPRKYIKGVKFIIIIFFFVIIKLVKIILRIYFDFVSFLFNNSFCFCHLLKIFHKSIG